jgi:hypothetical protein
MKKLLSLAGLLLLLCTTGLCSQAGSQGAWVNAQADLNAWFAVLEPQAIKAGQFVEIKYTYTDKTAGKAWRFSEFGFIDSSGDKDVYFTPDLIRQRFRTKSFGQDIQPVNVSADFKAWIATALQKPDDWGVSLPLGMIFRNQPAYWFMLSRACAFRGLQQLAQACLERSKKDAKVDTANDYKAQVERGISSEMFLNIKSEMSDSHYSRPFLIRELAEFIATKPSAPDLEGAQKYKAAYEQMV